MKRSLLCLHLLLLFAFGATAQQPETQFLARQQLIDSLYSLEDYAQVIRLVDLQTAAIKGTSWNDSLYLYTYKYGRAHWKVNGGNAGVQASEKICEEVLSTDSDPAHYLSALGDLSWLYYEIGALKECLRVDSIGLQFAKTTQNVPAHLLGRAHQYMGFDYSVLGHYQKAAEHFLAAVEVFEHIDPPMRMNLAEGYNGVGAAYWHLGRNKEAEQHYLKSLEWLGDSEEPEMVARKASAIGNLSLLWEDAGDLMKSKDYARQNLGLQDLVIATSDDPFVRDEAFMNRARTYSNLAALYHAMGDYATSRTFIDKAWSDRSEILEADDIKLMKTKKLYSDLEYAAGNYTLAEKYQQEFIDACMKSYGLKSEYTTRAMIEMANIVSAKGEEEQADMLYNEAIEVQKKLGDENSDPILALGYLGRAQHNTDQGFFGIATTDLLEARKIYVNMLGDGSRKVARCDVLLAANYLELEELDKAGSHINLALTALDDGHNTEQELAIPRGGSLPYLLPEAIYYKVLIDRAGLGTNAHKDLDELDRAISILDRSKAALMDEESKLLLLGAQKKIFDLAQSIAFEQSGSENELVGKVFSLSEENKSILMKSRLNTFASLSYSGVPDTLIEREQQLIKAMEIDAEDRSSLQGLAENEKAYADLLAQIQKDHPQYFELRYGKSEISITDVQKELLLEGQSLIAYSITDEFLYTILIEKERSKILRSSSTGIGENIFELNEALKVQDVASYTDLAFGLYQKIFAPVEKELRNSELLIIPDEELYFLNFEALISEKSSTDNFKEHLLIQDYTISYLLSASTAVQFNRLERERASGALAMAPGFSDELKSEYLAGVQDSSNIDHFFLRHIQQPFAVRTAGALSNMFSANVRVGNEASEAAFKELATEYGIIHLGTHTEINNASPLYSKLILSKEKSGSGSEEDGYLHAYEIYKMELKAELTVLTACETGTGKQYSSEGVRSLAHSFAYAGCPSLVMSLWKIDEKSSAEVITDFYTNLSEGQAKNKALRAAKLAYLERAPTEQAFPYYWAGLVLVGDAAPISGIDKGLPEVWIWVGVGVLLLLMFFFFRNRNIS